jgi:ESCRT-I complex subunit VPS37
MAVPLERNIELRDELLASREATAQAYSYAEGMKMRWTDIEKAQSALYQVSHDVHFLLLSQR